MRDANDRIDGAPAICARGLTRRYGDRVAVDSLDLDIARGEFYGLLGPNGAGKTTALHMLSTLIRPTEGIAWVDGHSVVDAPLRVRAAIGVVFQESSLDAGLTAAENLRFAGMLNRMPPDLIRTRSAEMLELFELADARGRRAGALSGGMRRALDLARGMMHHPRILFLDEPTIGLDVPNRAAIWRHIAALRARLGTTVVLTTHYLEEAEACDRVGFIDSGRLVREGGPRALIAELDTQTRQPNLNDVFLNVLQRARKAAAPVDALAQDAHS
jgi:ABC-2 type transport system ATP-binding protein